MSHHHVIAGLAIVFLAVASLEEWSVGHSLKEVTHSASQGVSQVQPAPAQTPAAPAVPSK